MSSRVEGVQVSCVVQSGEHWSGVEWSVSNIVVLLLEHMSVSVA